AEYGAALAIAFAGDSSRAQRTLDELTKRFPDDSMVKFSYVPVLRAVVALNHREPYKAIDLLQAANACELGYQGANSVGFAGSLYPIYVRGEALLRNSFPEPFNSASYAAGFSSMGTSL
ncbi:MAG TPA: hypothetical protein VFC29_04135, partial [Candidatus Limnocylindrales bacterium]|nr:hypothetical protein [Candidatus Limnocylindrales bacterium]